MSLHVSMSHDAAKLSARLEGFRGRTLLEVRTMARSAMGVFVEFAKAAAPQRSGKLAGSLGYSSELLPDGIRLRHRSGGATGAGVPYARFVVDGTGVHHRPDPHSEWDVDKFQRFVVGGTEIRTMHTHHQGQRPNDFEHLALERLMGALPAIAATGGRRLVRWIKSGA